MEDSTKPPTYGIQISPSRIHRELYCRFYCYEKGLIVEIDGGQHSEQQSEDEKRTHWLESQGFQVIRFWNNQVLKETESVAQGIAEILRKNNPNSEIELFNRA